MMEVQGYTGWTWRALSVVVIGVYDYESEKTCSIDRPDA
jgi:hypothetical protein